MVRRVLSSRVAKQSNKGILPFSSISLVLDEEYFSRPLNDNETRLLSYGLKHSVRPKHIPTEDILSSVEFISDPSIDQNRPSTALPATIQPKTVTHYINSTPSSTPIYITLLATITTYDNSCPYSQSHHAFTNGHSTS